MLFISSNKLQENTHDYDEIRNEKKYKNVREKKT